LVGAGTAALLAVGLAPILTSGVAQAASTNTPAIAISNQTVIGVGDTAAAGDVVIGATTTTFNAGDTITIQVAQPGVGTPTTAPTALMNANCNTAAGGQSTTGDRRFVAYAATPTAAGPTGGTLTLLPGVAGSSTAAGANGTIPGFCNVQDGGTRNDIFTFTVATTGPGPITIGNIQYSVGRGTGQANLAGPTTRLNSATTGPVRQFIFFTNVSTGNTNLTKLNTAENSLVNPDSNAWITTIAMAGPPKSFAVTTGTNLTKTISGITITEKVADAFGAAGSLGNTFCIDIASGNATFGASPNLSVTGAGLATDLLQSIAIPAAGPGGPNTRITITIANNPASVLSAVTLNNVVLNINAATVGSVRAILTDCADQAGPGGSLRGQHGTGDADGGALASASAGDGAPPAVNTTAVSAFTFEGIGNFSGPNDSVNDLNRVVLFFLLLADRSGGNDRVATARILQQEKYGLAGVNLTTAGTGGCSGTPSQPSGTQLCGGARFALVATADNFPDALSASYAAGRIGAAILLVRPTVDALAQVQLALQNLGVVTVLVLGGPAAVPDTVVDFLKGLNSSCTVNTQCGGFPNTFTNGDPRVPLGTKLAVARIQDPLNDTRYGTMRLLNILTGLPVSIPVVVQQTQPAMFNATKQVAPVSPANVCTSCRTAFVVSGANFPDALSAGVRSYAQGIPMILTDPAALSPEASQTLKDLQTQQVVIVGGETAVSAAVADSLTKATQDGGLGLVVARVSGADRIATAVAVMQYSTRNPTNASLPGLGLANLNTVLLARSDTFPDSLTAAVQGIGSLFGVQPINGAVGTGADPNKLNYAGNAAILLAVNPTTLGAATASQLTTVGGGTNGLSGAVNAIKCIGLQAAISDATCTAAQSALAGITT
jgi:putative cell wall-binding protein